MAVVHCAMTGRIAAGVMSLALAAGARGQCSMFRSAVNYTAGSDPTSVALGDFNHDGKLDIVTTTGNGAFALLLGNGDGTFGAATRFLLGSSPRAIVLGDFNGDGNLDVATANGNNTITVSLGNGAGLFASPVGFAVGTSPQAMAAGDFNGDGKLDLAVGNFGSGTVSILLGDGAGGFGPAMSIATGSGPSSIAIGDFNRDGKLDLAVANYNQNNVSILLGTGTGAFLAAVNYTGFASPSSIAVGDFNGDGRPDLAVANNSSTGLVAVMLGTGSGTFGAVTNYAVGSASYGVAVVDLNRDGKLDLVVARYSFTAGGVSTLLGAGDGTFGLPINGALTDTPTRVAIGDLNGDGRPDLAVANVNNVVSVVLALGGPPSISFLQQPATSIVNAGQIAEFHVMATTPLNTGTLRYQWRREGVNLVDGPTGNGSSYYHTTLETFQVRDATIADDGAWFDCVLTNDCGTFVTRCAALGVRVPPTMPMGACCNGATCAMATGAAACGGGMYLGDGSVCAPVGRNGVMNACCPVDFNGSGVQDVQDIFDFFAAWFAGCP